MKKLALKLWVVLSSLFAWAPLAFADSGLDINKVLADSIVGLLIVVIPVLAGFLAKLIVTQIKKSNTEVDDRLAAIAVAWAEDQLKKGDKLQGAAEKLVELSKGKISRRDAETLVAATYQRTLGELADLKK